MQHTSLKCPACWGQTSCWELTSYRELIVFLVFFEMTTVSLSVRVWGGVLRRARRPWCPPEGRRTSTSAPCVTTTPRATTTACGPVRGARPSSRGASKVRLKHTQGLWVCDTQPNRGGIMSGAPVSWRSPCSGFVETFNQQMVPSRSQHLHLQWNILFDPEYVNICFME